MPEIDEDIAPLENGIERCKNNVKIFEDAIEKEREQIKEYYFMIDTIERKRRQSGQVIEIVAERDDD